MAQFQTHIFHANPDVQGTNKWASELIGDEIRYLQSGSYAEQTTHSLTTNLWISPYGTFQRMHQLMNNARAERDRIQDTRSRSKGTTRTAGWQEHIRKVMEPSEFVKLPTGGPAHGYKVGAHIITTGKQFKHSGKPHLYTLFSQKA